MTMRLLTDSIIFTALATQLHTGNALVIVATLIASIAFMVDIAKLTPRRK